MVLPISKILLKCSDWKPQEKLLVPTCHYLRLYCNYPIHLQTRLLYSLMHESANRKSLCDYGILLGWRVFGWYLKFITYIFLIYFILSVLMEACLFLNRYGKKVFPQIYNYQLRNEITCSHCYQGKKKRYSELKILSHLYEFTTTNYGTIFHAVTTIMTKKMFSIEPSHLWKR